MLLDIIPVAFLALVLLFLTGFLPVPVGYERGKVKYLMWCNTGMHAHIVYSTENGFQTLHPKDNTHSKA